MSRALSDFAGYSEGRINASKISNENFVTTDNLLQNKAGVSFSRIQPKGNLVSFDNGDILVGNIRPYLKKIWYADRSGGSSQDVLVLKVKDGFDSKFIYYCLFRDDFFRHMMRGSKGTKMPRGEKNQILRFPIPDFDPKTQKRISSLLSLLDRRIELNKQIISNLEGLAKTLFNYWFVQFNFPNAKEKPYRSSGGKMEFNDKLKKQIPTGWRDGTASDLFDFNPSLTFPRDSVGSYIDMNALPESGFMIGEEVQRKAYNGGIKFQNGDLMIARITPCLENGKTGLVTLLNENEVGFGSTEFIVLRGKSQPLSSFVACLSRSDLFRKYAITNMTGTSGRKRVEADTLARFPMAIPPDELLDEFEKTVGSFFKVATANVLENQKLAELRDWLLPMLMNGQVQVKDEAAGKVVKKSSTAVPFKPTNTYFYQTQFIAAIVNASKQNKISHGEMTLAKYSYLVDKIYKIPTCFSYERWHLGPYPKEMKKVVLNKKFFKIQNNEVVVVPPQKEYNFQFQNQVDQAITELASIFNQYKGKERSRQTELLATICKVVEDIQSIDFKAVRGTMENWPIKLDGGKFKSKAEKFGEQETKETLAFIKSKGWIDVLLN